MTDGVTSAMTSLSSGEAPARRGRGELDLVALRAQDRDGVLRGVDRAVVYDIPMRTRFRGITRRDGVLLHGPAGWGEVAPFWNYDADQSAPWLAAALECATRGLGGVRTARRSVPVNVTVPQVGPAQAQALVAASGASTAKVKVAGTSSLAEDLERLEAVRQALGPDGHVRVDVNASWDLEQARRCLVLMDRAGGGLEYVEQPCASVEELAALRRSVSVPVAADESVRLSQDPLAVVRQEAADVIVLKVAPLGGVRRCLALAERAQEVAGARGVDMVVSSALDTSVGIEAGLVAAAGLPRLDHACGLGTVSLLEADVAVPSVVPHDGVAVPGHLHVSRSMLAGCAAGEEVTARWQVRMGHLVAALAARRGREAHDPATAVAGLAL